MCLDVETSGLNPGTDQIIELGFLHFEGLKLVERYQSLVQIPYELAPALTKLTGITPKMLASAPSWDKVLTSLQEISGATILAHNADFERSFIGPWLEKVDKPRWGSEPSEFVDSLFLFPLLDPSLNQLSLEYILRKYQIKQKEDHRALSDSEDLIKALIVAHSNFSSHPSLRRFVSEWLTMRGLDQTWYARFLTLEKNEVLEIAEQMQFDPKQCTPATENGGSVTQVQLDHRLFPENFSGQDLEGFFKDEKKIQTLFPGYTARSGQLQMANRVGQCLKNKKHAMIQAPTGIGKTFAYLVPALSFVEHHPEQVLIATGTKALQTQAMEKDLPALLAFFGPGKTPKVSKLIGSSNHWCEMLFRSYENENYSSLLSSKEFSENFFSLYLEVLYFYHEQGHFFTREDFPSVLKSKVTGLAQREATTAVDFRSCLAQKCPYRARCSYIQGLKEARESQIIVGNHALMFQWPKSGDRPTHIIVDEAHRLESEATRALTLSFVQNSFEYFLDQIGQAQGIGSLFYLLARKQEQEASSLIQSIRQELVDWGTIAREHWDAIKEQGQILFQQMPRFTELFWNERPYPLSSVETSPLGKAIAYRLHSLAETLRHMRDHLLPHYAMVQTAFWKTDEELLAKGRFETFYDQLSDFFQVLEMALSNSPDYVSVFKYHAQWGLLIEAAPLDVGKAIFEGLLKASDSVVMTSATLGTGVQEDGRGMQWQSGYIYVPPEKRFKNSLSLPPVFDYRKNAKIFLCTDGPKFSDQGFVEYMLENLLPVIRHLRGKSLLLFSSRQRFDQGVDYLLRHLGQEMDIFIQGMGKGVVEDFKRAGEAVLIGMESFSEGIDIPGEGLQFIGIDKIPDLRQELIIDKRREFFEKNFGQEFRDYFMAHRAGALHQKLGRLLRTPSDVGAAIIFDSRAQNWKGRTLQDFFQLMEPYHIEIEKLKTATEKSIDFLDQVIPSPKA